MPDEIELLVKVAKETGSFTAHEFMEALIPATQKYAAIIAGGREFELWYFAVLIGEAIRQNRFTAHCLSVLTNKKAAADVGERA